MTRVTRGLVSQKRRKNVLKAAKGYRLQRSKKERAAKVAIKKAGVYAFAHRRDKKNDMRKLWNVRLNAALRENGTTYSKFISALKKANVELDRKCCPKLPRLTPQHLQIF